MGLCVNELCKVCFQLSLGFFADLCSFGCCYRGYPGTGRCREWDRVFWCTGKCWGWALGSVGATGRLQGIDSYNKGLQQLLEHPILMLSNFYLCSFFSLCLLVWRERFALSTIMWNLLWIPFVLFRCENDSEWVILLAGMDDLTFMS